MKKPLRVLLAICIFVTMFTCTAYADFELGKGAYLWFVSEAFPSFGEIIEQMILPEFESADTLPEMVLAVIRSINGLLFAAPYYVIAILGFFTI